MQVKQFWLCCVSAGSLLSSAFASQVQSVDQASLPAQPGNAPQNPSVGQVPAQTQPGVVPQAQPQQPLTPQVAAPQGSQTASAQQTAPAQTAAPGQQGASPQPQAQNQQTQANPLPQASPQNAQGNVPQSQPAVQQPSTNPAPQGGSPMMAADRLLQSAEFWQDWFGIQKDEEPMTETDVPGKVLRQIIEILEELLNDPRFQQIKDITQREIIRMKAAAGDDAQALQERITIGSKLNEVSGFRKAEADADQNTTQTAAPASNNAPQTLPAQPQAQPNPAPAPQQPAPGTAAQQGGNNDAAASAFQAQAPLPSNPDQLTQTTQQPMPNAGAQAKPQSSVPTQAQQTVPGVTPSANPEAVPQASQSTPVQQTAPDQPQALPVQPQAQPNPEPVPQQPTGVRENPNQLTPTSQPAAASDSGIGAQMNSKSAQLNIQPERPGLSTLVQKGDVN